MVDEADRGNSFELTLPKADQKRLDALTDLDDLNELFSGLLKLMNRLAQKVAGKVITTSLSGKILKRRAGSLARDTVGRSEMIGGLPAIRVGIFRGPSRKYAGILERGGVIKPRKAKALAIPQEAAQTAAGVDRFGGPRGYPGKLRFQPFKRGVAVGRLVDENEAAEADKAGLTLDRGRTLYLLVTQVRIPAFKWLSKPVREQVPMVADEIAAFIKDFILRRSAT